MSVDAEREIDGLFDRDPDEFVAARDDLARRLRAAGERDAAGAVRDLRRPTVAAWAVNQVVRQRREQFEALLAAGADLEQAQRRVLSGLGADALRAAAARRRELLEALRREAARILAEAGRGAGHLDAVADTLEAASADRDAAREVGRARLERELPPPAGFGGLGGLALVPEDPPPAPS